MSELYIAHHGVLGMKWGIRRYQPYGPGEKGRFVGEKRHKEISGKEFDRIKEIHDGLSEKEKYYLGDQLVSKYTKYAKTKGGAYIILDDYGGGYKDEHPYDGKIISIAASKDARGKGMTDKLISGAKKEFPNDRLIAEIDSENHASKKLFERNGFKPIGKIGSDIDVYAYDTGSTAGQKVKKALTSDTAKKVAKVTTVGASAAIGVAFIASPQGQALLATSLKAASSLLDSGREALSTAKETLNQKAWDAANSYNAWIDKKLGIDFEKSDKAFSVLDTKIAAAAEKSAAEEKVAAKTLVGSAGSTDQSIRRIVSQTRETVNDPEVQSAIEKAIASAAKTYAAEQGITEEQINYGIELGKKYGSR